MSDSEAEAHMEKHLVVSIEDKIDQIKKGTLKSTVVGTAEP